MSSVGRWKRELIQSIGAIAGGSLAYAITRPLPELGSAFACAVTIITLSALTSTREAHPILWWTNVGAIAGGISGTAGVLASTAGIPTPELNVAVSNRFMVIAFMGIAGFVSGLFLGRGCHQMNLPRPKEFLKGASALTTVAYAVLVTLKFALDGLDPARTLSSRLSTTTTILAAALAVPGWVGYRIGHHRFDRE
jgi:hypothetical protein